jgi:hypothetical protein
VGDDPGIFTMGMVAIGLVLGIFIGLLAWTVLAPEEATPGPDQVSEDLDAMARDVDSMRVLIDQVDERATGQSWELEATMSRLDDIRTSLDDVEARLSEIGQELDDRSSAISDAEADLSALGGELMDVRMELVGLRLELEDLLARIIAGEQWGGGGGGGGNATVPDNATLLPAPHLTHFRSSLLVFSCDICHDIEPSGQVVVSGGRMYWNGSLDDPTFNTVIDRDVECVECHGQFPETGMQPDYIDVSCVACHDDWADRMTATYVRESAIGDDDCLLCHGGANAFIDQPQKYSP